MEQTAEERKLSIEIYDAVESVLKRHRLQDNDFVVIYDLSPSGRWKEVGAISSMDSKLTAAYCQSYVESLKVHQQEIN